MKKIIIMVFLLSSMSINAGQMGGTAYTAITGEEVLFDVDTDLEVSYRVGAIPDLKGAYELTDIYVAFATGITLSSSNSTFSGTMSITSKLTYQSLIVNSNPTGGASSYTQTANVLTFTNIGAPQTVATYTWDGTYLKTTLSNSTFTEIDTWKRVEDLSTKQVVCNEPEVSTYNNGVLHIPTVAVPDGFGGTVSYKVDMDLVPFKEPLTFELNKAEKR